MPDATPTPSAKTAAEPRADPEAAGVKVDVATLAQQLAFLQPSGTQSGKHEPLSVRARTEHLSMRHLAFADIEIELANTKITRFNDGGEFETMEHATAMALPDGSRVNKTEDIAYWCCRFRKKKQLAYCGPMTKERANFCSRCNRVLCAHHSWQFLFSAKKHCAWCLFVRGIELSLTLVGLSFKLGFLIARGFWHAWFRTFQ